MAVARWPMPIGAWARWARPGRRAHFLGHGVGDVAEALLVLGEDARRAASMRSSRLVREKVAKAFLAARDGAVDIGLVAQGDDAGDFFGGRVDDVERLVARPGSTHWPSM